MSQDGLDLGFRYTLPMNSIDPEFEQEGVISKIVLGIREKFLPLLRIELRRDLATCMIIGYVHEPWLHERIDKKKLFICK